MKKGGRKKKKKNRDSDAEPHFLAPKGIRCCDANAAEGEIVGGSGRGKATKMLK